MNATVLEKEPRAPQPADSAEEGASFRRPFVWLLAATTVLHLALALRFPLSEDEAYYWEWSRHLDWGYYDQGPMIAWWMRGFCAIFGDTVMGVRMGAIVASLGLVALAFATGRRLFGEQAGFWGAAILSATPLAIVGGFVFTYDVLQILFWAAGVYGVVLLAERRSLGAWALVGGALGMGLLSKLTMALFVPCALLFFLSRPALRSRLSGVGPWLALGIAGLLFLPNLLWQLAHDGVTFQHMQALSRSTQLKPLGVRLGDFLGSQAAVVSPVLAVALTLALVWAARRRTRASSPGAWLLWCFSAPVLVFFLASAFNGKVLGNWAAAGWYAACLLLPAWLGMNASANPFSAARLRRRRIWALSVGIPVALLLTALAVVPEPLAAAGLRAPQVWNKPVDKMFGGRELAAAAQSEAGLLQQAGAPVFFAATQYQEASRLGFHVPGNPDAVCLFVETRTNQWLLWNRAGLPQPGSNAILVLDHPLRDKQRPLLERLFERIEPSAREQGVFRGSLYNEPVETYFLYRCYGFRPERAPEALTAARIRG